MVKLRRWINNAIESETMRNASIILGNPRRRGSEFLRRHTRKSFFPGNELIINKDEIESKLIIDGDSYIKVLFDIIIMILVIILTYLIPYCISFNAEYSKEFWRVVSAIFALDMFLTFNTSYFSHGNRITNRNLIAVKYLKGWFFIDLISSLPLENLNYDQLDNFSNIPERLTLSNKKGLRLLLLFKILRIFKYKIFIFNVKDLFSLPWLHKLISILTYFFAASIPLHVMTCLFNILYCNSLFETYENYDKLYIDNWTRYIRFFLRSIETMTSVGYGEFTVKTTNEKILIMVLMSLTSGMLGYFVGGFQSEIEKSNQIYYYFRDINKKVHMYCSKNKIPSRLKDKIKNYLRNLREMYTNDLIKEQDILNLLSSPMREEVFVYIRGHFLIKVEELNSLSGNCLRAIGFHLKLQMFGPGDLIIKQDEMTADMYFIIGGTVEVFHQISFTTFKHLSKPSFFGELSFFTSEPRTASIKSYDYSEVLILRQLEFSQILKSLPKDKEKIRILKRNLSIYGVKVMKVRCYLCLEVGHVAKNCSKYQIQKSMTRIFALANSCKKSCANFNRQNTFSNPIKYYTIQSVNGCEKSPKDIFKENNYLTKRAENYNNWIQGIDNRSSRMLSLIINDENDANEQDDENSSNSSRDDFINFELRKTERFNTLFSPDNLGFGLIRQNEVLDK
ncbi:hypothetical protein SteCoe_27563 [Stentor coeruleus]|uniref:Cyclic nucleotide-binding domain-containing protein n=1 Tax=Stentor coeruleus TaxID=5963 RepID=A0A1R2BA82_9CILI|nr:hypothetical protein SteCoe_27563 [Stentor coeruleus]